MNLHSSLIRYPPRPHRPSARPTRLLLSQCHKIVLEYPKNIAQIAQ